MAFRLVVQRLTNLRYADDIILLACSEIQLQELVDQLERVSRKYGLLINAEKTKTITTNSTSYKIVINNSYLERVTSFPYLGSLLTDDTECSEDIRRRLVGIRAKLKMIWQNHGMHISTKIGLTKALIGPTPFPGRRS